MIQIDTGSFMPQPKSAVVDDTQNIRFTDWTRADRTKRQVIDAIYSAESEADLTDYMRGENILIDALYLFDPVMADDIAEAEQTVLAGFRNVQVTSVHGGTVQSAQQSNSTKDKVNMFDIDTGGGSQGPWIAWQVQASRDGQIPAQTFYMRDKDSKSVFAGFDKGVVMDFANMKVGWQHSAGIVGKAPEWKWWSAPNQRTERPGDEWKWGATIPCAIGGGETATWEQAGAAIQNAIEKLIPALNEGPGDGSLPMVKLAGVEPKQFGAGSTVVPILEVIKWVPRPDCLKEGFKVADTAPEAKPQATAPAAPAETSAPADVDANIQF